MSINPNDVKALREKTGAGMMKCKEALSECKGDFEAAIDYLRKKGLASVASKQSRVAADGMIVTSVEGNKGVLLEVNCETDFVSKGVDFKSFADGVASYIVSKGPKTVDELKDSKSAQVSELTIKCGEKIDIRRFSLKTTKGYFGHYNHGGKIGVLVEVATTSPQNADVQELAKDLAMHVAASSPKFLAASDIDEGFKKREADIYEAQLKAEGKPANMIPNIIQGKLKKLASEVCLLSQKFVKNPDIAVENLVDQVSKKVGHPLKVVGFEKFVLGEGIEKRTDSLADEVAKMTGKH